MNSYHKYMLFYTGLQVLGVYGILEIEKRTTNNDNKKVGNLTKNQ